MNRIDIHHTRQHGTLIYGTSQGDSAVGQALHEWPCNARGSQNLPERAELGAPYWYFPHSRRRRADIHAINTARDRLTALGHEVVIDIDDTTPAVDFASFLEEKYTRAGERAVYYAYTARRAMWQSEAILASNQRTYDALAGTPILVDHYSATRHRRLLERLWKREGQAWALYDEAKYRFARSQAASRFRTAKESTGTTLRRIQGLEKQLRDINRSISRGHCSEHALLIYAADVFERVEEIDYWHWIIEESGAKVWGPDDFDIGDFVQISRDSWHEIVRVNDATLSVIGSYDLGPIHTVAANNLRGRLARAPQTLPYDKIHGRMSAAQARTTYPDALTRLDAMPALPPKPSKKRGKTKLDHQSGPSAEFWRWTIDDLAYTARWQHPPNYYSATVINEPGHIQVSAQRRTNPYAIPGEPVDISVRELVIAGPVYYVEDVHNQVRAFVESRAYVPNTVAECETGNTCTDSPALSHTPSPAD